MTCPQCGAVARPDAAWCGQCHAAFSAAAAPAAPGRFVPVAAGPTAVPEYSRWRGGPTSFGPAGRISWTVAVLLVAAFSVFSGDIFFMGLWMLFVGPIVLRSVWKRDRIR
ncbi:MAG: hypothetical protein QOC55_2680 [Thermoleophilaceae bacterium]|nr:hypothetical protein [Thermoleophilaceae bacterium]